MSTIEHPKSVDDWVIGITKNIRMAIKGQITATLYPYRFDENEFLAFDLDGAEGSFSLTFMTGRAHDLDDLSPWVPNMFDAIQMSAAVILELNALVKFSPALKVSSDETIQ